MTCNALKGPGIETRGGGGGKTFRTHPDRPWNPPSHLYNGYRVSLPGIMRPPASSYEAKETVELYLTYPLGLHGLLQGKP
jgi:hypothetical protein